MSIIYIIIEVFIKTRLLENSELSLNKRKSIH